MKHRTNNIWVAIAVAMVLGFLIGVSAAPLFVS